jgi:hypothetical protein
MRGILAIMMAVGGTALISYVFITLQQNRRRPGYASGDSSASPGSFESGSDSWNIASWVGGDNSASEGSGSTRRLQRSA